VGGAQRTNTKGKQQQRSAAARKQQQRSAAAAKAVAAARGSRRETTKIIIGVVVVIIIAAAVVGGVLYQKHKTDAATAGAIPNLTVAGSNSYPATVDKNAATVLVGKPGAKVTLDMYEDFTCPICGEFEQSNFTDVEKQLEAGKLQVRYHMLNLLDNNTSPAGYSMLSANAALAVATVAPDKFMDFHYSLYQHQPKEGGAGWTQDQLVNLAGRLGVNGQQFTDLVNNKSFNDAIQKSLTGAENNKALFQTSSEGTGFGTPTIVPNSGKPIDTAAWQQSTAWLDDLVKAAYPS
jgi:protein-disulfide isomerase